MTFLAFLPLFIAALQAPEPGIYRATFQAPGGVALRYTVSVPPGYDGREPRALLLALHPGGERFPYVGGAFMQQLILPALFYQMDAFIIAPDAHGPSWADPATERAVVALVRSIMADVTIDSDRVLVAGFSMGGRGTWFLSSRHADLFTGAIVLAGSAGDTPVETLAPVPTYVIHSREDDVVPFRGAESTVRALEKLDRPVMFEAMDGAGHFDMSPYVEPLQRGARWITDRWND